MVCMYVCVRSNLDVWPKQKKKKMKYEEIKNKANVRAVDTNIVTSGMLWAYELRLCVEDIDCAFELLNVDLCMCTTLFFSIFLFAF